MHETGLLVASGISKSYAGIAALDGVDLEVGEGELVGLVGPNGAGKTTLFDCLLGVTAPDRGTVSLAGIDLAGMPVYRRARLGLGRTFQRLELFSGMSVHEHLLVAERARRGDGALWKDALGLGRTRRDELERTHRTLELLGLGDAADRPIESLSLGRARLVDVGRALMTQPRLLLLDEPSSGLDRSETDALAASLGAVHRERGVAVLLVEHDLELVRTFVSRLYVMDSGRVLASGPTEAVLRDELVRSAYVGTRQEP
jgi:branched-chain amino acid transport system ATP-binding protein